MAQFKHFFLTKTATSESYTATGGGSGKFRSPPRDSRDVHGNKLLSQFDQAKQAAEARNKSKEPNSADLLFIPLAIEGFIGKVDGKQHSGIDLDKLDSDAKGIRIVNVREVGDRQIAMVAIPKDQLDYFERRIRKYVEDDDVRTKDDGSTTSKPKNQKLVESISELRLAALPDFYTDSDRNPPPLDESIWWEVWLESLPDQTALDAFKRNAGQRGIEFSDQLVRFPEVVVILAKGTLHQWSKVEGLFGSLAEFRRAKILASEFVELPPSDQAEFVNDLLGRVTFAGPDAPAVTILDTGVNRGHPLLGPAMAAADSLVWNGDWKLGDVHGHGTEIAGVAVFGARLKDLLISSDSVAIDHRLESVKILPDVGHNHPPDYGAITAGSMVLADTSSPNRQRVFCLAVTADDRDEFRPTLWSAAIDQSLSGRDNGKQKLAVVSAGNLFTQAGESYPDANHLASVQDPAQSWNALTVGGYTDLVQIREPDFVGWNPVAPKEMLSPSSTTSLSWRDQSWPIKPELVLEGGNYATDGKGVFSNTDDLSILTTTLETSGATLGLTKDTSPAAADAARMAAIIRANYPDYWPETVRGMLVHNAHWTKEMVDEFPAKRRGKKLNKIPGARLRAYGWGVPDLDRSVACAKHVATMVIQDSIQPYTFDDKGKPQTHEMSFHALPLPRSELAAIGDEEVEMRVTLSYFIEPSPGRKGWNVNHRYASHGLRFEVIRPLEDVKQFKERVSRDFWDGKDEKTGRKKRSSKSPKDDRHWAIGEFGQTRGSIHSDFWQGTAGQLADSGSIVIFPITGWWRERPSQGRVNSSARYSLIVTIRTKKTDLDVYHWVETEIRVPIAIENES